MSKPSFFSIDSCSTDPVPRPLGNLIRNTLNRFKNDNKKKKHDIPCMIICKCSSAVISTSRPQIVVDGLYYSVCDKCKGYHKCEEKISNNDFHSSTDTHSSTSNDSTSDLSDDDDEEISDTKIVCKTSQIVEKQNDKCECACECMRNLDSTHRWTAKMNGTNKLNPLASDMTNNMEHRLVLCRWCKSNCKYGTASRANDLSYIVTK